jgi:Spy/CpxP family protein refolding chaperone
MLTSAQIRNHRLKPVRVFYSEEKFREGMYKAIQPTEEQKVKIDQILDKYSKLNSEATSAFRKEFEARMEKFRTEVDSNLTPEQIARLKELDAQRQKMIESRRGNHGMDYHERKPFRDSLKSDSLRSSDTK